jgi:dipeptidyl aminopeptidase/acylaminoacyl peptidase
VDVNYRGSNGFGRDYIEQLNPNWGLLDADDCISVADLISRSSSNNNKIDPVDPNRVVIRGGSSGGFTVLCALSHSRNLSAFGAGTSLYGISNLVKLVEFTHKFESSYMDKLLGGKYTDPGMKEVYEDRSPLSHAGEIKSPLLVRVCPIACARLVVFG